MSQESTVSKEMVVEQASPSVLPDDPARRGWVGNPRAGGGGCGGGNGKTFF